MVAWFFLFSCRRDYSYSTGDSNCGRAVKSYTGEKGAVISADKKK
jgi:hypothetical protein